MSASAIFFMSVSTCAKKVIVSKNVKYVIAGVKNILKGNAITFNIANQITVLAV